MTDSICKSIDIFRVRVGRALFRLEADIGKSVL